MKKPEMKEQVSALVKVGKIRSMFPHSADSEELLIAKLEKHGMSVSNVVTFKTHHVLVEKPRGRHKSKY